MEYQCQIPQSHSHRKVPSKIYSNHPLYKQHFRVKTISWLLRITNPSISLTGKWRVRLQNNKPDHSHLKWLMVDNFSNHTSNHLDTWDKIKSSNKIQIQSELMIFPLLHILNLRLNTGTMLREYVGIMRN